MIRNEKGITLSSLMIYVIAIVITISILTGIMTYFNSNVKYIMNSGKYVSEFNKFNMYFIEDVKNNRYAQVREDQIAFEDGTIYTYKSWSDRGIYRNKVKICSGISYCYFSKSTVTVNNTEKYVIRVHMLIEDADIFEAVNEYVLKYW